MCGIVGILESSSTELEHKLRAMTDTLGHRGPDAAGLWYADDVPLGFGHTRLAVIDLSETGSQPMQSSNSRYTIVYNGEIYNFKELRTELESLGATFVGGSDTEVLLSAIQHWGLEQCLSRLNGMFAFALYDQEERVLTLVRDRLGIKPLFYGWYKDSFIFASELKAFFSLPGFCANLNYDALGQYMRFSYVPAPFSIFDSIFKLEPGHFLRAPLSELYQKQNFDPLQEGSSANSKIRSFWSLKNVVEEGNKTSIKLDESESLANLDQVITNSVKQRMISDVPLGAFLSGGIDSSLVVAIMQKLSSQAVRSFSIGFEEQEYDEARHAKAVAQQLGTKHTELYVSAKLAQSVIPRLPSLYDEPFADSSQIPTYLVSELARSELTVALSGDGGDELFCGYNRYIATSAIWSRLAYLPKSIRSFIALCMLKTPRSVLNCLSQCMSPVLPKYSRLKDFGNKFHKLGRALSSDTEVDLYYEVISQWDSPDQLVKKARDGKEFFLRKSGPKNLDLKSSFMFLDLLSYLPDDLLTKVDRASMGVSLEVRVPFLDHKLVEYVWSLPIDLKYRNGTTKWLLRQLLYKYVPRELVERPKMGFSVPISDWLRGPLKNWAFELLFESEVSTSGILDQDRISLRYDEHLSGRSDWQASLWNVLMFNSWIEEHRSQVSL